MELFRGDTMSEMSKKKYRINKVKPFTNASFNVLFILLSFMAIFPIIYITIISLSSEDSIKKIGYSLKPLEYSLNAYKFLWKERPMIMHALWVSLKVTIIGTVIGVFLTTTMGYVLSRKSYRLRGVMNWVVFIPMIFNGGMVANYVVYTNILKLENNIWVLILPLAVSSFNIIISKTFFRITIPDSIVESAKIDGASQFGIFFRIVVPISKPILATIGLFLTFGYWNDWFLSSLYIRDNKLYSIQALLNTIMENLAYIARNPEAGVSLQQYRSQMPSESVRMAIAIVVVLPIAMAYPFFQKYFISGLTVGAVKG